MDTIDRALHGMTGWMVLTNPHADFDYLALPGEIVADVIATIKEI